jgi:integrase
MMKLCVGGKPLKRSARTTSRAGASKQLEHWKAQIRQGTYVPDADQTRFDDLATLLIDEYRANARKSLGRAEAAVDHLKGFFAGWRAQAISTDRVLAYVRHRQQQQAANATINRELAALKRMFRLGERAGRIVRRPFIDLLQEHNARTGFFEREECDAVLAQLPDDLQPVFAVAYLTGWRVKSELLTRQWAHVDFQSGWLRLEPGETKNAEGRQFPLTPALRAVLERQRARTLAVEDGRPQDGEHLPTLRDCGRGDAEGGRCETANAPRGPGARGPGHPADQGDPHDARQFEYRPSQPGTARATGPGGAR